MNWKAKDLEAGQRKLGSEVIEKGCHIR